MKVCTKYQLQNNTFTREIQSYKTYPCDSDQEQKKLRFLGPKIRVQRVTLSSAGKSGRVTGDFQANDATDSTFLYRLQGNETDSVSLYTDKNINTLFYDKFRIIAFF